SYSACGMSQIKDARGIAFLTNEYYETAPPEESLSYCGIKNQTLPGYPAYQYAYHQLNILCCSTCTCGPLPPPRIIETTVTDPRGTQRKVTFDFETGYPLTDTRALGRPEEQRIQ